MKETERDALWLELQELEAGTLDPARRAALMERIRYSADAQRAYLEYFEQTALIEAEAAAQSARDDLPAMVKLPATRRLRYQRPLLALAATIAAIAGIATLFLPDRPQPSSHLIADAVPGTQWSVDGRSPEPGAGPQQVGAGATVEVTSGTVTLRIDSGATLVMQGPARVSFPELDRPLLHQGWLWMDSGASDTRLEIGTPELLVQNLGTRFGVHVPDEGEAEVHVVKGEVKVFDNVTRELLANLKPEEQGISIGAEGELWTRALARDPFPGLGMILEAQPDYPNTVRSQNPSGYWRLEEADAGKLTNQVAGGLYGRFYGKASITPGPGPRDGFPGLGGQNRALRLPDTVEWTPVSFGSAPIHRGILFQEDFVGAGPLHGTIPSVTMDAARWVAVRFPSYFGADGQFRGAGGQDARERGGSATLPFQPVHGVVYTLDASLRGVTGDTSWIGLGFAKGRSPAGNKGSRFVGDPVGARAWMLLRGSATNFVEDTGSKENKAFLGSGGRGGGTADGRPFFQFNLGTHPDMDLRIVLDTTGGAGKWTATWYARPAGHSDFVMVRETTPLINESIDAVGFALAHEGVSGKITNFSLHAQAQPPGLPQAILAEAPARVAREEGAISFWMRRQAGVEQQETLWAAGEDATSDIIHAHLTFDGRAGLFVENGRYDAWITSEQRIDDGQWHHLAMSWGRRGIDLYIDGELAASDPGFRPVSEGILPELRFGSGSSASRHASFNGWIDEIGFWDRSLTPDEVRHQLWAARGETTTHLAQSETKEKKNNLVAPLGQFIPVSP